MTSISKVDKIEIREMQGIPDVSWTQLGEKLNGPNLNDFLLFMKEEMLSSEPGKVDV